MEITCCGHEHTLSLVDVEKRGDVLCDGCNESITAGAGGGPPPPAKGCTTCDFFLHESCAGLPRELLLHPLHPHHALTLVARAPYRPETFRCKACTKICRGFSYSCCDCGFDLDVNCASLISSSRTMNGHHQHDQMQHHHHPSHEHPFLLCDKKENSYDLRCSRCGLLLEDTIYVCAECILLLHRSCAELDQEIGEHPFHPQHRLKLNQSADAALRLYKCNICKDRLDRGFAYSCSESGCLFRMDLKCASTEPLVLSEIHPDPLAFHNLAPKSEVNCSICDRFIKCPYLWCMECGFIIHVHCFPTLPPIVKYRRHIHPLLLTDSPIKDYPDEDEEDDFYCDACEELRQLNDPCFYCEECHYVAHVHCAFVEILPSIRVRRTKNETDEVDDELNEEIAVLQAEVKAETTQIDALKAELKEIEEKHALFFSIAMSALKIA